MGSTSSKIPQPYRWYHPHMSWLDMLFNWIAPYLIINFDAIVASDPTGTPESSAISRAFRDKFKSQELQMAKGAVQKWSQTIKCPIAEVLLKVPRRPNLLREWKLTEDESFETMMPSEDIVVHLYVPVSILNASLPLPDEDNEVGAKQLEPDTIAFLKELPGDVPLVVNFHGGGMNIGAARNRIDLDLVQTVSALENKPLIFASVEYSLVPEYQFPVAPVEGMTVLAHFLDSMPNRQLHVAGSSAGGYMATVTCMEIIRRYPGRMSSLTSLCPMLDPMADTESYYMNQLSFVTSEWARWCWQALLGLPRSKDTELPANPTLDDVYRFQSNRTTYNQSRWKGSSLERLARPIVDIPPTGELKIIMTSNMADPLEQDSMQYAAKLKEMGAKVTHLVHRGSHSMGTYLESHQYNELAETWHRVLFE